MKLKVKKIYINSFYDSAGIEINSYDKNGNFNISYYRNTLNEESEDIKYMNKYFEISTGVKLTTAIEYYVFSILHEAGHMNRICNEDFNFDKYIYQKNNLDIWSDKQFKNRKINYNKLEHIHQLKYRKIEEEKIADKFALDNFKDCMKYLKNNEVVK